MWVKDKNGNWVNSQQIFSLVVAADPNASGYYVVLGYNQAGTVVTTLWDGHNMSQAEAAALQDRLVDQFGSIDPTA